MKNYHPKNEEKLWKGLEEVFRNKDSMPTPILSLHVLNISIQVWKHFKFKIEFLETYPYKIDGEVPMIFVYLGPIELVFENKFIYKYLYKLKYKIFPRGL